MYDITSMHLSIRDSYDAFSIKISIQSTAYPPIVRTHQEFQKKGIATIPKL
jgi:hypothetical protein